MPVSNAEWHILDEADFIARQLSRAHHAREMGFTRTAEMIDATGVALAQDKITVRRALANPANGRGRMKPGRVGHVGEQLFDLADFSRRIRVRIAERNITQLVVAQEARVSTASLSRICNMKHCPDVESYLRLTEWLATLPQGPSNG